jgi:hypothetical protein
MFAGRFRDDRDPALRARPDRGRSQRPPPPARKPDQYAPAEAASILERIIDLRPEMWWKRPRIRGGDTGPTEGVSDA